MSYEIDLDNWRESDFPCPECGATPTQVGDWWDDHPDSGGACIGDKRRCVAEGCDWFETY